MLGEKGDGVLWDQEPTLVVVVLIACEKMLFERYIR
jgi:hypothetical protein